jgi:hypothetical protein
MWAGVGIFEVHNSSVNDELVEYRIIESGGELVRRRLGVISVGCITGEGDGVDPEIVLKTQC